MFCFYYLFVFIIFACFYFLNSFYMLCIFLCCKNCSRKNLAYLDSLIYYTTDVYPYWPPNQEIFFTKSSTKFFTAFTYFYLCALIFMLESLLIWENIFLFIMICGNLVLFMIICENLLEYLLLFIIFVKISKCTNTIT